MNKNKRSGRVGVRGGEEQEIKTNILIYYIKPLRTLPDLSLLHQNISA